MKDKPKHPGGRPPTTGSRLFPMLGVRLPPDVLARLKSHSEQTGEPLSSLFLRLAEAYLASLPKKPGRKSKGKP